VAKSGTAAFMEQMASGADLSLIGQFGVGFYSAYLAADKVRVVTKNPRDETQWVWESTADGSFTIAEDPRGNTLGRGTEITLFLKEEATEYGSHHEVEKLLKKYSEFITFPIYLEKEITETYEEEVEAKEDAAAAEEKKEDGEEVVAEEAEKKEAEPEKKKEKKTRQVKRWEQVNDQKAIWQRKPEDITPAEYNAFYKTIAKDERSTMDPLTHTHFNAEGEVEFRSILYIPGEPPSDLFDNYYQKNNALKLYVRKVLISDEFEDLMPRYLSFIKGVVDSDDLPLNVSRETLQQHKILRVMGKKLVRKALEMLRKLAKDEERAKALKDKKEGEDAEKKEDEDDDEEEAKDEGALAEGAETAYTNFWEKYGKAIKLGIIEDSSNRSKLAKLLRFKTTVTGNKEGEYRSFDDYVASLKDGQKSIYYITGESYDAVVDSPFLEKLRAKGLEVIFFVDAVDEYAVQQLPEFDGHRLQSITKEGLQLPGDDDKTMKRREKAYAETFKPLTSYLKEALGGKVEKVAISHRLATSPCILATSQYGYSANMERLMRAQAFADPSKQAMLTAKKTLEINPRHPIIAELLRRASAATETDSEEAKQETKDLAFVLYDTALLNSGFPIDEPKEFSSRMYRLMKSGMSLESLELQPEIELPAEEAEEGEDEEDAEGEEEEDEDVKEEL
jgi:heat shock protein beta